MAKSFKNWKDNAEHLPSFLRDHTTQGKIFRFLCSLQKGPEFYSVNDAQAAVFVIDIFLWVMANSGYTLQKTRTKFNDIGGFRDIVEDAYKWDGERHRRFMEAVIEDRKTVN